MKISEIIKAVTDFAPPALQESWDNTGVQVGDVEAECTGVLLCVDCTPEIISEAKTRGCNLVVAHHPLIFKGLKHICPGDNQVQQTVIDAIRGGVTVYSAHTSLDSTIGGISHMMARMLGAEVTGILSPGATPSTGLGVTARLPRPLSELEFVERIKAAFGSQVVRCSRLTGRRIENIALCGGSGGEFIPRAISLDCDAYLTSDTRYHDFVDFGKLIFLTDIGHFESEQCAKQIFYNLISEIFPNFALYKSESERNSINYL